METTQANPIVAAAQALMAAHNKKSLELVARSLGWRGDPARTAMINLALYVATEQAKKGNKQNSDSQQQQPSEAPQSESGDSEAPAQSAESSEQPSEGESGEAQAQQSEQSEGDSEQQQSGEGSESESGEESEGNSEQPEQGEQKQPSEGESESAKQPENSEPQQQQQQPEPKRPHEEITHASAKEWKKLLASAGIQRAHPMLRKVFNLTLQNVNVYLKGPAGSGKTTLAKQLSQVRGAYFQRHEAFGFLSVTEGMSESHLLGWRLPADNGEFKYFPSSFVTIAITGGVFLLDELDAGNSNVILITNSALANGMFSVPQRTECPIVHRHADHICMGAGNTDLGAGADEMYPARSPVDGSTGDRFQQVNVDYDPVFEASLFGIADPAVPTIKEWAPTKNAPTAADFADAYRWFIAFRAAVEELKLPRIIGRTAEKLVKALHAGCSLKEAKADQMVSWSADEVRRVSAVLATKGV